MASPERQSDAGAPEREPSVNPVQQLQFELMKLASFNGFAGEHVVKDLIVHRHLWRGAIMDSGYQAWSEDHEVINLTKLRDIEHGQWNVDTLFLLPNGTDDAELMRMASQDWGADEVGYVEEPDVGIYPHPPELKILRVWWG